MESKKKMTILIVIALIIVITAISLRVLDSNEVPTSIEGDQTNDGSGEVGVTIIQSGVEDKLANNPEGSSA